MQIQEDKINEIEKKNLICCGNCKWSYRPRDCKWSGMIRRACERWEWDEMTREQREI